MCVYFVKNLIAIAQSHLEDSTLLEQDLLLYSVLYVLTFRKSDAEIIKIDITDVSAVGQCSDIYMQL